MSITIRLTPALALLALAVPAFGQTPIGDVAAGKIKSEVELCQGCHGADGNSGIVEYPKLIGQRPEYLLKQLRNFQSGARKHGIMSGMAAGLTQADMADIAAYFGSGKTMAGDGTGNALGQKLFAQGDSARGISACANCHGADGKGSGPYPVIGGQYRLYLRGQLLDWRLGARSNSPDGVMNHVAKPLTDADIEALAEYAAGL